MVFYKVNLKMGRGLIYRFPVLTRLEFPGNSLTEQVRNADGPEGE